MYGIRESIKKYSDDGHMPMFRPDRETGAPSI